MADVRKKNHKDEPLKLLSGTTTVTVNALDAGTTAATVSTPFNDLILYKGYFRVDNGKVLHHIPSGGSFTDNGTFVDSLEVMLTMTEGEFLIVGFNPETVSHTFKVYYFLYAEKVK